MSKNTLPLLLPYPFREFDYLSDPPTTLELCDVFTAVLEQCASLAAGLHGGLDRAAAHHEDPARFAPTALLLQETLQVAVAIFTAWQESPEARHHQSRTPKEKATSTPA